MCVLENDFVVNSRRMVLRVVEMEGYMKCLVECRL